MDNLELKKGQLVRIVGQAGTWKVEQIGKTGKLALQKVIDASWYNVQPIDIELNKELDERENK